MNLPLLFLTVVCLTLAFAAVVVVVMFIVVIKKNNKLVVSSPGSLIESLPYRKAESEEVNALVDSAIKLWLLEVRLNKPNQQTSEVEADSLRDEIKSLKVLLDENDMYYFDPTGQHYKPTSFLEIASADKGVDLNAFGTTIVIAESPAVIYRGELVQKAKVNIVAR